jgi:hypothetical protein
MVTHLCNSSYWKALGKQRVIAQGRSKCKTLSKKKPKQKTIGGHGSNDKSTCLASKTLSSIPSITKEKL